MVGALSGATPTNAQQKNTHTHAVIELKAVPDLPGTLPEDRIKCWVEVKEWLQKERGEARSEMDQLLKKVPAYCSKPLGKTSKRAKNCQRKIRAIYMVAREFNRRVDRFVERIAITKPVDLRACRVCGNALIKGIRERLDDRSLLTTYVWERINEYRGCSLCGCTETVEYRICNQALPSCYKLFSEDEAAFQACVNLATHVDGISR